MRAIVLVGNSPESGSGRGRKKGLCWQQACRTDLSEADLGSLTALPAGEVERRDVETTERFLPVVPRTRYFRTFLRWCEDRGEIARLPRFPNVSVPEREPVLLSLQQQDAALQEIPIRERGIYLAMVDLAMRPGEARPLRGSAVEIVEAPGPEDPPAWIRIDAGVKGSAKSAPVAGTRTGRSRRVPATERLVAWILAHTSQESRVHGDLLFPSPRGGMYAHASIWRRWRQACADAGVPLVPIRQASRHSTATDLLRKGAEIEKIRRLVGHSNVKMTERYARWSDQALWFPSCGREERANPNPELHGLPF